MLLLPGALNVHRFCSADDVAIDVVQERAVVRNFLPQLAAQVAW